VIILKKDSTIGQRVSKTKFTQHVLWKVPLPYFTEIRQPFRSIWNATRQTETSHSDLSYG